MTDNIQKIIDQILSKSNFLHKIVIEERDKNSHLNIEIERLNKLLSEKNEECLLLSKNLDSVQSALSLTENKVIENPGQTIGKSEQEIDELVKEIEFCIEQLKQ
jgi:septal ring factor EnvC (AmiA/AmiB activator)